MARAKFCAPTRAIARPVVAKACDRPIPIVKSDRGGVQGVVEKSEDPANECRYASVLYRVAPENIRRGKRKRNFEDGVVAISGSAVKLFDDDGKAVDSIRASKAKVDFFFLGNITHLGKYEVELLNRVSEDDFASAKCFLKDDAMTLAPRDLFGTHKKKTRKLAHGAAVPSGALSLEWPPGSEHEGVTVFVPTSLARSLRPHQREGIQFLFECLSGSRSPDALRRGAILADAMGLGKTVQVIALVWALYLAGLVDKCVVVTPSSLVGNWAKEFRKWVGNEQATFGCVAVQSGDKGGASFEQQAQVFAVNKQVPVLICSYEAVRKQSDFLDGVFAGASSSLVVCDEAHRLKNAAGSKTLDALKSVRCDAKVAITATPVQNNLSEFFSLVDFVLPNLLGEYAAFVRLFQEPILRGEDPSASSRDKELAAGRSDELRSRVSPFILRRTQDVNKSYLKVAKREYVLFCPMTHEQRTTYAALLRHVAGGRKRKGTSTLQLITALRQLVSHPAAGSKLAAKLLQTDNTVTHHESSPGAVKVEGAGEGLGALLEQSNKTVMASMIVEHAVSRQERVVVVSDLKLPLDLLAMFCAARGLTHCRIDGSTPVTARQDIVDSFNKHRFDVCLLSLRAGGVGLNLVGGQHLVLLEVAWNPALDAQAVGRIYRDGQDKDVCIYRLVCQGTIEEVVYQRQIKKEAIAGQAVEGGGGGSDRELTAAHFTPDMVQQLFALQDTGECETARIVAASHSTHLANLSDSDLQGEPLLARARERGVVSACMRVEA